MISNAVHQGSSQNVWLLRHIGFALFLFSLLIAPEVDISILPVDASISWSVFGLSLWVLASRPRLAALAGSTEFRLLMAFCVYILIISLLSERLLSAAYALYYAFHLILGGIVFRAYYQTACIEGQSRNVRRILLAVGIAYALGAIASMFMGPIYPTGLGGAVEVGSLGFYQAVGFSYSNNHNSTAAILLFFCLFSLFEYKFEALRYSLLTNGLMLIALAGTVSRGAILGFIVGLVALLVLVALGNSERRSQMDRSWRLRIWGLLLISVVVLAVIAFERSDLGRAAGVDADTFAYDLSRREFTWRRGINAWFQQDVVGLVFGQGFYNSSYLGGARVIATAHNLFVSCLGDFGMIGLLLLIGLLGLAIYRVAMRVWSRKEIRTAAFAFTYLFACVVSNFSGEYLYSSEIAFTFMLVLLLSEEQPESVPVPAAGLAPIAARSPV